MVSLQRPLSHNRTADIKAFLPNTRIIFQGSIVLGTIIYLYVFHHLHLHTTITPTVFSQGDINRYVTSLNNNESKKIIIFAGPRGTGFQYLQKTLWKLSKADKLHSRYSWALPDITEFGYEEEMGFDPMVKALFFYSTNGVDNGDAYGRRVAKYFIDEYRSSFVSEWMKNRNIMIGTEMFDIASRGKIGESVLDILEDIFPWKHPLFELSGSLRDITVVVNYRPSRLDHAVSSWVESTGQKQSFSEWISTDNEFKGHPLQADSNEISKVSSLGSIDSFKLAKKFASRGYRVLILDVESISRDGHDLGQYIACNILKENCHNHILDLEHETPEKFNIPSLSDYRDKILLSDDILHQVDTLLKKYDCSYMERIRKSYRISFFQAQTLPELLSSCPSAYLTSKPISTSQMYEELKELVSKQI